MGAVLHGVASGNTSTSGFFSTTWPASYTPTVNDIAVLFCVSDSTTYSSYPSGYTRQTPEISSGPDGQTLALYYKRLDGTEGSSPTVSRNSSFGGCWFVIVIRGVDVTTLLDVAIVDTGNSTTVTSITPADVTLTSAGGYVLIMLGFDNTSQNLGITYTGPSGWTEVAAQDSANYCLARVIGIEQVGSGLILNPDFTVTPSYGFSTWTMALRSAASSGSPTTTLGQFDPELRLGAWF